ncbi:hypothetical protein RRG08_015731 [Elysia crispata]|uniref:Uncharacterized protein n=1 Tax=Elysia crispata TaxID=231223 RepID=A0AAE1DAQ8_9GAST|nr:hypothetical protein RRG08_015731 [Elysia crispata]
MPAQHSSLHFMIRSIPSSSPTAFLQAGHGHYLYNKFKFVFKEKPQGIIGAGFPNALFVIGVTRLDPQRNKSRSRQIRGHRGLWAQASGTCLRQVVTHPKSVKRYEYDLIGCKIDLKTIWEGGKGGGRTYLTTSKSEWRENKSTSTSINIPPKLVHGHGIPWAGRSVHVTSGRMGVRRDSSGTLVNRRWLYKD